MNRPKIRTLLCLSLVIVTSLTFAGCMAQYQAADEELQVIKKRMDHIENDAKSVHSKKAPAPPGSQSE